MDDLLLTVNFVSLELVGKHVFNRGESELGSGLVNVLRDILVQGFRSQGTDGDFESFISSTKKIGNWSGDLVVLGSTNDNGMSSSSNKAIDVGSEINLYNLSCLQYNWGFRAKWGIVANAVIDRNAGWSGDPL